MDSHALEGYCTFDEERVYLLLAIARLKDNPDLAASDQPVCRRIVTDADTLTPTVEELTHSVSRHDESFRLYLSVNARDTTTAFFRLRERMDDWLEMRFHGDTGVLPKFKRVDEEFASVLQSDACAAETKFLFDLDDATAADAETLESALEAETTVHCRQATPNGYHLVTAPFDYTDFESDIEYELKTDGLLFVERL